MEQSYDYIFPSYFSSLNAYYLFFELDSVQFLLYIYLPLGNLVKLPMQSSSEKNGQYIHNERFVDYYFGKTVKEMLGDNCFGISEMLNKA